MKKLLILFFAIVLVSLLWFFSSRFAINPATNDKPAKSADKSPSPNPVPKSPSIISEAKQILADKYPRWEGGRSTDLNDPRWKIKRERESIDRAWQGKMPIDFFGKVIDFEGLPVEGAVVKFIWTDLSPAGSTQSTTRSDANGLFALTKAVGKNLGVDVSKEGYYTARQEHYGFEYAAFYDEHFYQPD